MKKGFAVVWLMAVLMVIGFSSQAFGWAAATHVYVTERVSANDCSTEQGCSRLMDELYGANGPDMFNYSFDIAQYLDYLSYALHNESMTLWQNAGPADKPGAFGFLSHNDVWAADFTAHHGGVQFGKKDGYVIKKAQVLNSLMKPTYDELGIPDDLALFVSHLLLENGLDVLTKRLDPTVGQKLMNSAMKRSASYPLLLSNTYAAGFSSYSGLDYETAASLIENTEQGYRTQLLSYGYVLMQDEETAIYIISQQMAGFAKGFLAIYGISIPQDRDLTPDVRFAITKSIEICQDSFEQEMQATIGFVQENMSSNGVTY